MKLIKMHYKLDPISGLLNKEILVTETQQQHVLLFKHSFEPCGAYGLLV